MASFKAHVPFPPCFHVPLWETALYIKWHANLFFLPYESWFSGAFPTEDQQVGHLLTPHYLLSHHLVVHAKEQDFWSTGFKWFVALRRCVLHCLISCVVILVTQGAQATHTDIHRDRKQGKMEPEGQGGIMNCFVETSVGKLALHRHFVRLPEELYFPAHLRSCVFVPIYANALWGWYGVD